MASSAPEVFAFDGWQRRAAIPLRAGNCARISRALPMSNDFRIVVAIDLQAGTDRLLAETKRYGLALNAVVDIIHVASPDPDFVGYMKSGDPGEATQDNQIRESEAKALRAEHQQTQAFGAALRASGVRVDQALTLQGPIL